MGIELNIKETVTVNVNIADVINEINLHSMPYRFNTVAQLLNSIVLGDEDLTNEQVETIKKYVINLIQRYDGLKVLKVSDLPTNEQIIIRSKMESPVGIEQLMFEAGAQWVMGKI